MREGDNKRQLGKWLFGAAAFMLLSLLPLQLILSVNDTASPPPPPIRETCLTFEASDDSPRVDQDFYFEAKVQCNYSSQLPDGRPKSGPQDGGYASVPNGVILQGSRLERVLVPHSGTVKTELTASADVAEITPLSDSTQPLLQHQVNTWSWRVRIPKAGDAELALAVTGYDESGKLLVTENELKLVTIGAAETTGQKVQRYWHVFIDFVTDLNVIVGAIIAIVGGFGLKLWSPWKKGEDQSEAEEERGQSEGEEAEGDSSHGYL